MSRIRNFVYRQDDVLKEEVLGEVLKIWDVVPESPEEDNLRSVDIPNSAHFETLNLFDEDLELTKKLTREFHVPFLNYQEKNNLLRENFLGTNFFNGISLRKYTKERSFQVYSYDSRSKVTAPIFLSAFYFLHDTDLGFRFHPSVSLPDPTFGQFKKNSILMFPSNFMFPYEINPPSENTLLLKLYWAWSE